MADNPIKLIDGKFMVSSPFFGAPWEPYRGGESPMTSMSGPAGIPTILRGCCDCCVMKTIPEFIAADYHGYEWPETFHIGGHGEGGFVKKDTPWIIWQVRGWGIFNLHEVDPVTGFEKYALSYIDCNCEGQIADTMFVDPADLATLQPDDFAGAGHPHFIQYSSADYILTRTGDNYCGSCADMSYLAYVAWEDVMGFEVFGEGVLAEYTDSDKTTCDPLTVRKGRVFAYNEEDNEWLYLKCDCETIEEINHRNLKHVSYSDVCTCFDVRALIMENKSTFGYREHSWGNNAIFVYHPGTEDVKRTVYDYENNDVRPDRRGHYNQNIDAFPFDCRTLSIIIGYSSSGRSLRKLLIFDVADTEQSPQSGGITLDDDVVDDTGTLAFAGHLYPFNDNTMAITTDPYGITTTGVHGDIVEWRAITYGHASIVSEAPYDRSFVTLFEHYSYYYHWDYETEHDALLAPEGWKVEEHPEITGWDAPYSMMDERDAHTIPMDLFDLDNLSVCGSCELERYEPDWDHDEILVTANPVDHIDPYLPLMVNEEDYVMYGGYWGLDGCGLWTGEIARHSGSSYKRFLVRKEQWIHTKHGIIRQSDISGSGYHMNSRITVSGINGPDGNQDWLTRCIGSEHSVNSEDIVILATDDTRIGVMVSIDLLNDCPGHRLTREECLMAPGESI